MSNKQKHEKMEKLNRELQEAIMGGELNVQQQNNRSCSSHWAGEELSMSSLRKNLKSCGLEEWESELKQLKRSGNLRVCLDDGWLHLELSNELLDQDLLNSIHWDR